VHADHGSAEWRETPATVEAVAAALSLPLSVVRQRATISLAAGTTDLNAALHAMPPSRRFA